MENSYDSEGTTAKITVSLNKSIGSTVLPKMLFEAPLRLELLQSMINMSTTSSDYPNDGSI